MASSDIEVGDGGITNVEVSTLMIGITTQVQYILMVTVIHFHIWK